MLDKICKLSIDHEKLYSHKFQGNPVRTMLLKKSAIEKAKLIKKIEDKFLSTRLPTNIMGREKNNERNKGIKIKANGIRNLKELSKVNE